MKFVSSLVILSFSIEVKPGAKKTSMQEGLCVLKTSKLQRKYSLTRVITLGKAICIKAEGDTQLIRVKPSCLSIRK